MAIAVSAQQGAESSPQTWFFGPGRDLLLGCGLIYLLVFVLLSVASSEVRWLAPSGLLPLLILFTGIPHYGATLLRVYERQEDRNTYALFAVFATALVWALFAVGVHSDFVGSLILTLYLTWSPWHYTAQNYGIAMMFLGRQGVRADPLTKRLLRASFTFCFLLTLLAIHAVGSDADYAPLAYEGTAYHFVSLDFPGDLGTLLLAAVGVAYVVCLVSAGARLLRVASLRQLAPVGAIALTQALWFSAPVAARYLSILDGVAPLSLEHSAYAFLWVGIGHSVQYLWVTSYFASRRDGFPGHARHYGKALLAGAAIWVVPGVIFAPAVLGRVPYDAGLAVMVAAIVNIHHFILDGAVWKLRDGRVARILLRGSREDPRPEQDAAAAGEFPTLRAAGLARAGRLVRPLVYLAGAASVLVFAFTTIETELGGRRATAQSDVERLELATERLGAIGRASSRLWVNAAVLRAREGNLEAALAHVERARALFPTDEVWRTLGYVTQQLERREEAVAAYRQALIARPGWAEVENNLAWLLATVAGTPESAEEAVQLARNVSRSFHGKNPNALDTLAVAHANAGRFSDAQRTAEHALKLARASRDEELAAHIEDRLALYRRELPYRER